MKRNLLKGIILIGAAALSSCSTLTSVSKSPTLGDDVYYTKATAGTSDYYVPQYMVEPQPEVARNDDYYYYGDYESRIRRFGYSSPFGYNDDYYDDYVPYSPSSYDNTADQNYYAQDDYTYDPYYDDLGVYSAYDFGYGDYYGYDNYGYGIAYSTFVYSGGTRATHRKDYSYSNNNSGPAFVGAGSGRSRNGSFGLYANRGNSGNNPSGTTINNSGGPVFTGAGTAASSNTSIFRGARPGGNNAVYPGRPGTNVASSSQDNSTFAGTNRPIRPANQNPRPAPVQQQQPTFERSSPPQTSSSSNSSSSSSSGGGGGGGSSSGGGGRPVRP